MRVASSGDAKAAEHDGVDGADAGGKASHRDRAIRDHRQVEMTAVALAHAEVVKDAGERRHLGGQLPQGEAARRAS